MTLVAGYLWSGAARGSITNHAACHATGGTLATARNTATLPGTRKGERMAGDDGIEMTGKVRDKLIERKQDWARDGRLLTGTTADPQQQRLPPGQRLVKDWPVLDLGQQPLVTEQKFRLDVDGAVENRLSLSLQEFMALPQTESVSDMHCVTQWSRYDNRWKGVAARTLLEIVKPRSEVNHVIFTAFDGYTTNIRLDQFDLPDVFLVHQWEGEPIPREHGGPVRMLVPRLYLWKSAKWIRRIHFTISDHPGFWEVRGYHNNADPWLEERYG
jgi:DMSO/TMAO reductase YedYZ molybdopterin-dependent catalytic subunit